MFICPYTHLPELDSESQTSLFWPSMAYLLDLVDVSLVLGYLNSRDNECFEH